MARKSQSLTWFKLSLCACCCLSWVAQSFPLGGGYHYAHLTDKEMGDGEPGASTIISAEGRLQLRPPHHCPPSS